MRAFSTIKKRRDFVKIMSKGQGAKSKGLVLIGLAHSNPVNKGGSCNDDAIYTQVNETLDTKSDIAIDVSAKTGFIASKKIGNAVCRNLAKRRMRAAVHDVIRGFQNKADMISLIRITDFVLIGTRFTGNRPFLNLKKDLIYCLYKMRDATVNSNEHR